MKAEKVFNLCLQQIESIVKLYCQVIDILNQEPLDLWWAQMFAASEGNIKKGVIINYGQDEFSQLEIKEHILNIQTSFKSQLLAIPEYNAYLDGNIRKLTQNILPPDSGLRRFLCGRSKERPNKTDFWHYTCFSIWLGIQIRSFACKRLYRNWNEISYDELMMDLHYLLLVTRVNSASLKGKDFDQVLELNNLLKSHDFIDSANGMETEAANPTELTVFCIKMYHHLVDDIAIPELYKFFYLLNSCFVDDFTKEEIVKTFQGQSFNKVIDDVYTFFKEDHSDISKDYSFVPEKPVLKSENLVWNQKRDKSCFNFMIGSREIQSLYEFLTQGKYISKDTDIISFAHILTGFPYSKQQQTSPINWINKEKQALALFVGELRRLSRESDSNHIITWSQIAKLFVYKGEPISFNLSTLYHQALLKNDDVYKNLIILVANLTKKTDNKQVG